MADEEYMLTTFDNEYNPFTHYKEWHARDLSLGHDTSGLLARIALTSSELSFKDQSLSIEEAMNLILDNDVEGIYRKITASETPKVIRK